MVLSNVFNVIGIHLLILMNLTDAMVVFSANFDDIKGIARKFVSDKVADDVVNAIASLNSNINVDLSVENEKASVHRYSGETKPDGNTAAAQKHVPQNKHNSGEENVNGDFAYEDKTPGRVKVRNQSIRNRQIDKNEQQYHPTMETVNLDHRQFSYTSKKPNRVWSAEAPTRYTEKRKTRYNHREKLIHDDQRELEKSHVQDQRLDERTQNSGEKYKYSKANEANVRYENSPNEDANSKHDILEPNTKIVNSEDTTYNIQISTNDETRESKKSPKNWKNRDTPDEPVYNNEKRVRSNESTSTFNSAISLIGSILGAALKLNTENAQD